MQEEAVFHASAHANRSVVRAHTEGRKVGCVHCVRAVMYIVDEIYVSVTYQVSVKDRQPQVAVTTTRHGDAHVVERGTHHCVRHVLCCMCIKHRCWFWIIQRVDNPVLVRWETLYNPPLVMAHIDASAYAGSSGQTIVAFSTCCSMHVRSPASEWNCSCDIASMERGGMPLTNASNRIASPSLGIAATSASRLVALVGTVSCALVARMATPRTMTLVKTTTRLIVKIYRCCCDAGWSQSKCPVSSNARRFSKPRVVQPPIGSCCRHNSAPFSYVCQAAAPLCSS